MPASRHPAWPAIALGTLLTVGTVAACGPGSTSAGSSPPTPSPRASATPAADTAALSCDAQALRPRPADDTIARIQVTTVAHARVTAAGPLALVPGEHATGRASATGTRMLRFLVGDARPGAAVVITVRVRRDGSTASCQAALRPRAVAVAAAAPPPPTAAPPAAAPPPPTAAAPPPPPPPTAASCHPLSDEGTCYEPGEFCRDSDHGVIGVAGDGKTIECEDNDGWRWEPI